MKKERGKMRSDRPSGRQTMETPEHSSSADPSTSLNQGQGPELKKKNRGLKKKANEQAGSRQRPSSEPPGAENRKPKSVEKK